MINMRYLFAFIAFSGLISLANAQLLNGKYQLRTKLVSASYHDLYEFSDTLFSFIPTSYNGLNTIHSINGFYKLSNDSIFFHVKSLKIYNIVGVERNASFNNQNTWSLIVDENFVYKTIRIEKIYSAKFFAEIDHGILKNIKIGNDIYYALDE